MFYIIEMKGIKTPLFILNDFDEAIDLFNKCIRDFTGCLFMLRDVPIAEMANYGAEEAAA